MKLLKRQTASPPFRFTFALLYIGITGSVAYLNGLTLCKNHLLIQGDSELGLGLLLLLLLGTEWIEGKHYSNAPPTSIAVTLLLSRMVLFEGMVALDCTETALFLYPMIPFSAHFVFGSRVSLLLSAFYVALTTWRASNLNSAWYLDPATTSNLLAFAFVMLFAPLIAHVVRRDEESRKRTEQLLSDLTVSHVRLRAYAEQVAELAAAEERNRLARDIHDSLGHYLTAVNIQLEKALVYQNRNPTEAAQAIRDAKQAAAEALRDVRHSVGALRNPEDHFCLKAALEGLVKGVENHQLAITFSITGTEEGYSRPVLMALYRTVQEGLTNIQKHAQASHIVINVDLSENQAKLVLRDDGEGFDTSILDQLTNQQQEFGLRGIRERIELMRGQLALKSNPQQGTEIAVTVPKHLIDLNSGI